MKIDLLCSYENCKNEAMFSVYEESEVSGWMSFKGSFCKVHAAVFALEGCELNRLVGKVGTELFPLKG